jgi:hypothetical protein
VRFHAPITPAASTARVGCGGEALTLRWRS